MFSVGSDTDVCVFLRLCPYMQHFMYICVILDRRIKSAAMHCIACVPATRDTSCSQRLSPCGSSINRFLPVHSVVKPVGHKEEREGGQLLFRDRT